MEQFVSSDSRWSPLIERFRRGEVGFLNRLVKERIVDTRIWRTCSCGSCAQVRKRYPLTWAEKVDKPVTVPVFDAYIEMGEVMKWKVPFGWIPAQDGDSVRFSS